MFGRKKIIIPKSLIDNFIKQQCPKCKEFIPDQDGLEMGCYFKTWIFEKHNKEFILKCQDFKPIDLYWKSIWKYAWQKELNELQNQFDKINTMQKELNELQNQYWKSIWKYA